MMLVNHLNLINTRDIFHTKIMRHHPITSLEIIALVLLSLWSISTQSSSNGVGKGATTSSSTLSPPLIDGYASVYSIVGASKIPASLRKWSLVHEPKTFSMTTMVLDHHEDGSWYIPSLHEKYSIGWNRTVAQSSLMRPFSCHIRFFGIGLASTLKEFESGGTGYIVFSKVNDKLRPQLIAETSNVNESMKIHCYYMTGKGHGSNFFDSPKTLGLAIYCPVLLDQEVGPYVFKSVLPPGHYCRVLAEHSVELTVHLRPTSFVHPVSNLQDSKTSESQISSTVTSAPAASRDLVAKSIMATEKRLHSVCTVQTFRNSQTGPMLFLFIMYYYLMGWSVIVYDRFGNHREFLQSIVNLPGVYYHPYTVYQLAEPSKYNDDYAKKQSFHTKYYYKMEKNWVKGYGGEKADTADQDMDKTKTYDHSRLEYHFMDTILFADADEFFFCPQAGSNMKAQRKFQQRLMNTFVSQGVEEMRFLRLPYAGLAPQGINNTAEYRATTDLTKRTAFCMEEAFNSTNVLAMFQCWSSASTYDDFPKSSDIGAVCPFHYNHWSCDGGRGGGRDWSKTCRCKVAFDMINFFAYKPVLDKCHMLHFNDNKYRFQLIRDTGSKKNKKKAMEFKFPHDNGNIQQFNPIAAMLMNDKTSPELRNFSSSSSTLSIKAT